jgi:hypothetical protein
MKDWRLIGQETFYKGIILKKIIFPDFWKKSYLSKNEFYILIFEDAISFVKTYNRGEEYLNGENIQTFWHAHCDFCTRTITTQKREECYCTRDYKYWVCKDCFNDFKEKFKWEVEGNDS